jgi:hypothetical protein
MIATGNRPDRHSAEWAQRRDVQHMPKLRNVAAVVAGTVTLGGAAIWFTVRPWWHRWGVDADEAARSLPGDDVVADAPVSDTRTITIDAPTSAVWPWLVQMGFGRGGWYSYDAMDMKGSSAHRILPELQELAVGDTVPTSPGGGFEVKAIEPGHALVLYLDTKMVRAQAAAAKSGVTETAPVNLQAGGALMGVAQPTEFAATWAFVVEPLGDERARLIERFRIRFDGGDKPWMKVTVPFMEFGVFAMVRRQLLGIKARAERVNGLEPGRVGAVAPVEPDQYQPEQPVEQSLEPDQPQPAPAG